MLFYILFLCTPLYYMRISYSIGFLTMSIYTLTSYPTIASAVFFGLTGSSKRRFTEFPSAVFFFGGRGPCTRSPLAFQQKYRPVAEYWWNEPGRANCNPSWFVLVRCTFNAPYCNQRFGYRNVGIESGYYSILDYCRLCSIEWSYSIFYYRMVYDIIL